MVGKQISNPHINDNGYRICRIWWYAVGYETTPQTRNEIQTFPLPSETGSFDRGIGRIQLMLIN